MTDFSDPLTILQVFVPIVAGIIAAVYYINKIIQDREDRKPKFTYEKLFNCDVWQLMILHPNKHINKIYVLANGKRLRLSDTGDRFERTMREGEGQNFDIGKEVSDDTLIEINFDGHKIKRKFKDISLYKHSGL